MLYSEHQHGEWHIIDTSSIFVEKRKAGRQLTYSNITYVNPFSMPIFLYNKEIILHMLFFKLVTPLSNKAFFANIKRISQMHQETLAV